MPYTLREAGLRQYAMQSDVVRLDGHCGCPLSGIGQPDPETPRTRSEGAIVISPPLSQSSAVVVKRQQRGQDQVWIDDFRQRKRRGTARCVRFQRVSGRPAPEHQWGVPLQHNGQADGTTRCDQGLGQRLGVEFGAHGAIDGNEPASRQVIDELRGPSGRIGRGSRELMTAGARLRAEPGLVELRQNGVRASCR